MKRHLPPFATALRTGLKHYNAATLRADLTAGLIVSLIALPLSMALSIAVGLPPQHGLYTAVVAGIVAALLGGSMTQVSGPTAAFVVILAPIVADLGLRGIIWCQILAGIMLVILGSARLGKLINFVPYAVTTGFTAGIGVVIGTLSLNDFLGLGVTQLKGEYIEKVATLARAVPGFSGPELIIGVATFFCFLFFGKITPKIPASVVGITLGTVLAWFFSSNGVHVDTLGSRFSYAVEGGMRQGIPPFPPIFHLPTFAQNSLFTIPGLAELKVLIGPAIAIAALAALESLLSATVADKMAGTKHDPNAELNGIGVANVLSGLASGIPATGAIARTATNIHAGGKTPVAAIFHAGLLLLYMLTLAPVINHIPMAALAALLLNTAWRMSHAGQFVHFARTAPRGEVTVLFATFILTVLIDMVAGVTAGILLAFFFYALRHVAPTKNNLEKAARDEQRDLKEHGE